MRLIRNGGTLIGKRLVIDLASGESSIDGRVTDSSSVPQD